MHIVSWNVAGWQTALSAIIRAHGSLRTWLDQHKIDILAIQESKTTTSKLQQDARALCAQCEGFGNENLLKETEADTKRWKNRQIGHRHIRETESVVFM